MKAFVATAGVAFGLLALAHVWRVIVEGWGVANPVFILTTLGSAAVCLWALRVFRQLPRS